MNQQPVQHVVVNVENKSNGFGLAGLIFSCIGWLTCGALCIPGAFLSFIGLLFKPRGTAIAGLIVGFPGVIFFAFVGLGMLTAFLGIGAAATGAVDKARAAARAAEQNNQQALDNATEPSVSQADPIDSDPEPIDSKSEPLVTQSEPVVSQVEPVASQVPVEEKPQEPAPMPKQKQDPTTIERTFADKSGKFKVEATVVQYGAGQVSLKRVDNGKIVTIDASKLSQADQDWLAENFN